MKRYADKKRNTAPTVIGKDDTVLVRQHCFNKLMPHFNPEPFTLESRNDNMISATRGSVRITRNVIFFKQIDPINTPINDGNTCEDLVNMQLCRKQSPMIGAHENSELLPGTEPNTRPRGTHSLPARFRDYLGLPKFK